MKDLLPMNVSDDLTRRGFMAGASALLSVLAGTTAAFGEILSSSGSHAEEAYDPDTWKEINGVVYGARSDARGGIGGGENYGAIVMKGDYEVTSVDALIDALGKARAGEVVFIPSETEIDLTARIYIDELVLVIPAGVTLAGDRGYHGSKGAFLTSDALKTPVMFKIGGPGVRITGLRVQGPNPKRYEEHHTRSFAKDGMGREYYYKFPVSCCIQTEFPDLEIDNCDLSAFTRAIMLVKGSGHHIHHNFIHKCQYKGLGYGVSHGQASSLIEYNLFDSNRHSLAGTGSPGCGYVARNNIELGTSLSHCFDMHGGRDRKDGTNIAGTTIEIYNNTFMSKERAVGIRGVPEDKCLIHHNWIMKHSDAGKAVLAEARTSVYDNLYGEQPVKPQ